MRIQKQQYILTVLAIFTTIVLTSCSGASDSGIVQHRRGTGAKATEATEQLMPEDATETEEDVETSGLYVIEKIDTKNQIAIFREVSSGRQSQYSYDTATKFLDKYGDTKAITSFLPGDVAEMKVIQSTQILECVQLSDDVWVQEDIVNYSFDENQKAFTIGKTRYSCDPEMDVYSGEMKVGIADIGKSDVLRAIGDDKEILSLSITRGHGYLKLANTKIFEGSFICVGDKIFQEVTKDMEIEVPEGKHLVTVANNGYGGSREVTITRSQATSLNLDELKGEGPKICKITFDVGVEGAVLRIDGKKADYSKPVEVQYGVHTISVEADGYDTITEKLVVNSKKAEIEIALTAASGSDDAEDADNNSATSNSAGNSSTNNTSNTNTNNNNNNGNTTYNQNNSNNTTNNNNSNGTGTTGNTNNDSSTTDYLTTLYNLLTSINETDDNNTDTSNAAITSGIEDALTNQ